MLSNAIAAFRTTENANVIRLSWLRGRNSSGEAPLTSIRQSNASIIRFRERYANCKVKEEHMVDKENYHDRDIAKLL